MMDTVRTVTNPKTMSMKKDETHSHFKPKEPELVG